MGILLLLGLMAGMLAVTVWLFMRIGKAGGSADAMSNGGRVLVTIPIVATMLFAAFIPTILSPFIMVACAIPISLLWTPQLVETALRPLWTAFDGGNDEVQPQPFYFRAEAHRKKGEYAEAIYEIHSQLHVFPDDFEGMMLLSDVQSRDLMDVESGLTTLHRILSKPGRIDREQILVMNRIADLQFQKGDLAAARAMFGQITARWPKTEAARFAEQRLAHLPDSETMAYQREVHTVKMREFEQNIGLKTTSSESTAPFENPTEAASRLVGQLAKHPQDWEARERLAALYALQFKRPDLAAAEYEILVSAPQQPQKAIVKWLNQLAELHLARPDGVPDARKAFQRIVDLFPNSPASDLAASRIARLGLEVRARSEVKTIKLGEYEQNIGLR